MATAHTSTIALWGESKLTAFDENRLVVLSKLQEWELEGIIKHPYSVFPQATLRRLTGATEVSNRNFVSKRGPYQGPIEQALG